MLKYHAVQMVVAIIQLPNPYGYVVSETQLVVSDSQLVFLMYSVGP